MASRGNSGSSGFGNSGSFPFLEQLQAIFEGMSLAAGGSSRYGSGVEILSSTIAHPWERKKKLGNGAHGCVFSAEDQDGFEFAVKQVPRDGKMKEKTLRNEIGFLSQLSHRNIVNFYGCAGDEENIYLYIELTDGSIKDQIKRTGRPIRNNIAVIYTRDILRGLIYLHSENVIHQDIKCSNILLDKTGRAKLADMGVSKIQPPPTEYLYTSQSTGSIPWMSPEVLSLKAAGRHSDVWSLGCAVYEMLKGAPPFGDKPAIGEIVPKIMGFGHVGLVTRDKDLTSGLKNFLLMIFVKQENRPLPETIAKHAWLK